MIPILCLFLNVLQPVQQVDSMLTVEQAVSIALEQNYDIKLGRNDLRIAENNNTIGNAGSLPTIGLTGGASQRIEDTEQVPNFGDTSEVRIRKGAKSGNYNAAVTMQWTLFDGLKMFATKDRLEAIEQLNNFVFEASVQNTIANVLKAFYNAALEQERLALLESTLRLSEERVNISLDRYEVGQGSKLEYLQAQVDLNSDRSALVRQQEEVTIRKYDLWQLLATDTFPANIRLEYDYDIDQLLNLKELSETAVLNNPDLLSLRSTREVAILITKERERELLPALNFNLGYVYAEQSSEVGFFGSSRSLGFNYGLSANMTLFDGLNQRREIQNARIQAETAEITFEQAKTQLLTAVQSAFLTYGNSMRLARLEQENLDVARENVEIALERFRIGRSNSLEIREAQNNAVNAEIRYLEALNTAKIAEIELLRLSGQIIE